jgi:hypothetical protein
MLQPLLDSIPDFNSERERRAFLSFRHRLAEKIERIG